MRPSFVIDESLAQLGANLKAARIRSSLTQRVLAERCGISLATLVKIEKGDRGIAIGIVASVMLALGLGTPLSQIAAGSDELTRAFENDALPKRVRNRKTL